VVERGLCTFSDKAAIAQGLGAVGVVVLNDVGNAFVRMPIDEREAARLELAGMAGRAFLRQHDLFGQVNENLDGLTGLGSDRCARRRWGGAGFCACLPARVFLHVSPPRTPHP
jgi:hypothetical protein